MLKCALAQINTNVGDFAGNIYLINQMIQRAVKSKCDVIVFPELSLCGYPPEDLLLKKHFIETNLKAVHTLAKKTHNIVALVGFVDCDSKGQIYNAVAIIGNGKVMDVYYKHELPNYGVFDEKRYFTAGSKRGLFTVQGIKCGITICEDIWVDQSVYAKEVLAKAKVLINLSSSPYEIGKLAIREKLLIQRALETKTHIIYVNGVGGQDELVFDGGSMVIDPKGRLIAEAKQFEEQLLIVDFNKPKADDLCERLESEKQTYGALVLGTRDYVRKNGFNKVVIGLSGGIDSALVATIAVDALGCENVVGISMPSPFNTRATRSDALALAKNLKIEFKEIPITSIFKSYLKTLKKHFEGKESNATEENIQARIRGNTLMAFSNKFGWLVLTTGNKSEMAVGYCTLYGDMSGGFAVIKDLYKTQVVALARWRNSISRDPVIPKSIIMRAPSAELRLNQTDEQSLGSYKDLDKVLFSYIEQHAELSTMGQTKAELEYAAKMIHLVDSNEYKRRQSPPGVKVSSRAFGRDWRLPLTNKYRTSS